MPPNADYAGMAQTLRENGYLVFRVPECNRDFPHGRHGLITRTASCEGKEPIPHGYHSSHMGTFGMWINCKCGHSFSDCTEPPTPWERHQAEVGLSHNGRSEAP